jgi:hypothetical protein
MVRWGGEGEGWLNFIEVECSNGSNPLINNPPLQFHNCWGVCKISNPFHPPRTCSPSFSVPCDLHSFLIWTRFHSIEFKLQPAFNWIFEHLLQGISPTHSRISLRTLVFSSFYNTNQFNSIGCSLSLIDKSVPADILICTLLYKPIAGGSTEPVSLRCGYYYVSRRRNILLGDIAPLRIFCAEQCRIMYNIRTHCQ